MWNFLYQLYIHWLYLPFLSLLHILENNPNGLYILIAIFVVLVIAKSKIIIQILPEVFDVLSIFACILILFVSLQFAFISPEPRFLSILNPLVVMVSVFGLLIIYNLIGQSRYTKIDRWFLFIMVAMILVYELFYNINTNLLLKPLGGKVVNYSDNRLENLGLENVEQYFHSKYNIGDSGIRSITKKTDLDITVARDFFSGKNVYVFDPTISWFGSLWHFRRYTVYNNELFVSAADLQKAIPIQDWLDTFSNAGVKSIYYIWAIKEGEPPNDERIRQNYQSSKIIAEAFERIGASADNIYNDTGKLSFKIYKIDFERLKNYEPR